MNIPLFIKNYIDNLLGRAKATKGMTDLEVEELGNKLDDFLERYDGNCPGARGVQREVAWGV